MRGLASQSSFCYYASMSIRKTNFIIGEYYHIYNRGVDKRNIFSDKLDLYRFLQSIQEFNTEKPIGSLWLNKLNKNNKQLRGKASQLVSIVAYCLNSNHFHFILTPLIESGIQKFMQRLGGYTTYFNDRHNRSGSLFQGKFKSKHIDSNEYLIHLSIYVNLNNDQNETTQDKLSKSSFEEYINYEFKYGICDKSIVLDQFKSRKEYEEIAKRTWVEISRKKDQLKQFEF